LNRSPFPPYTNHVVRHWGKLGLPGLAALMCLPGVLHAQTPQDAFHYSGSQIYTIHIPNSRPPSKFEFSVAYSYTEENFHGVALAGVSPVRTYLGDWEVTVAVDLGRCEIYCAYRRIPDALGRTRLIGLLLPPITAIRVYAESESKSTTIIVDPAGLRFPAATSNALVARESLYLPGKRVFTTDQAQEGDDLALTSLWRHRFSTTNNLETARSQALPLRI
jgi:hypothetical protein